MLRIFKYLKQYWLLLALAVLLLFAQANFELALPDYLSQIVNIGIQQGGVDGPLPEAIRQSEMQRVLVFLSDDEQQTVTDDYTLVEPGTPEAAGYAEKYPLVESEAIYVRNDLTQEQLDAISTPFARALLAVTSIEQALEDPAAAAQLAQGVDMPFDLTQLPAGMDVFALLAQAPAAQRQAIQDAMDQRFSAIGDEAIQQGAVTAVIAEYEAIGLDVVGLQTSFILRVGAIMLLVTLGSGICAIAVGLFSARTAAGLGRDLRRDLFRKVENFSNVEFDKFPTASLITRSTNDVTQLQQVTMIMIRMGVYAPILGVGGIFRAVSKGSDMWWTIAIALLVLVGVIGLTFSISMPKFRIMQKLVDKLNLVARENLSGMMVIRAFNRQGFEEDRFEVANKDLTSNTLFTSRVMVIIFPIMMLILNVLSVVILWVGAHQVAQATMQVGDMMAFLQYAIQIVMSFLMLSMLFVILPRASVSADRIADVLETEVAITDPKQAHKLNGNFKGTVEFKNVSFRYPGAEEDVLHDINFVAKPGETTAFIGSTGSGKSTIVNLIPRFYDVTEGAILLDGIDIREVTQHDLRAKIGYIPQKGMLFSGTIESNLKFGDEQATEGQLLEAVQVAQASEFVEQREEGLKADIAQAGANVSGGQKQRLSIARALVKKAPIYIFDDAFSALDFKTDAALRKALKTHSKDSTLLVVTQRVSTVKNAEQIIVLDQGKVVGKGTHDQLMNTCEAYKEIALSQLSLEELS